jgi:hypothetical protein
VQKVVPTLTSTSAEIYLSMVDARQHVDTSFILVPAMGRASSRGRSRRCIALHRSTCRGLATSVAREEERPPGLWGLIEAEFRYRGEGGKCASMPLSVVPRGQGSALSIYRPRGGGLQSRRMVLKLHMAVRCTVPRSC